MTVSAARSTVVDLSSRRPGIRPKQSLGQNFLIDPNIARKIAQQVHPAQDDAIVEIGPGTGSLTAHLAGRAGHLVLVELDGRIVDDLRARFSRTAATILHEDFLETDLVALRRRFSRKLRVVGNIPYHLTSPILFKIFASADSVRDLTIMIQREVARRIVARPGTKQYGILSVLTAFYGSTRILFDVSPGCFYPRPKVTSTVITVTLFDKRPADVDEELFLTVVKTAFGKRRKTLRNGLQYLPYGDAAVGRIVNDPDLPLRRRPEELTLQEFAALARRIAMLL